MLAQIIENTPCYPETLLDGVPDCPVARHWWAIYTKSRQEKALARNLLGRQIPFFLPLVERTTVTRGRSSRSRVPLFPGYIFLYGTEEERIASLTTNRISRILPVCDPEQLRRDLRQLRRLIDADAPLTPERRLSAGHRVRVRSGPFIGIEGVVLTRRGGTQLVVAVNFLQQGASIEIDDFMLEPVG